MRPDLRQTGLPLLLILALTPLAVPSGPAFASPETPQQSIEGQLMCYCGCSDLTVRVCSCGTADAIRADIARRLADGATPGEVVEAFVAQHGSQIRSAPVKSGFDLLAWVTPFAALLLAASALVLVVRRWRARGEPAQAPAGLQPAADETAPSPAENRALERVRREMRGRR